MYFKILEKYLICVHYICIVVFAVESCWSPTLSVRYRKILVYIL